MSNMSNIALYQVADLYLQDVAKLQDLDLDEQTLADTLEGLSGELEIKATNVAMFVRNLEATAETIKQAEAQMKERRQKIETRAERIRQYLMDNMTRTGITKIECPYFAIAIKKNPESVEIIDQEAIPDEFYDIPPPPAPALNKAAIKAAIKAGQEVAGARLIQKQRIDIK